MGFNPELLIPIIALLMPIAIVGIVMHFRAQNRAEIQKTVRMAIEKGQPLPPEYLDSLQKPTPVKMKSPMNDIRSGLILMAVAIGMAVWGYAEHGYLGGGLGGIAAIPGFIGLALLIMGIVGVNKKD